MKRRWSDKKGLSPAELTAAFAISTALIMGIAQTSSMTAKMAKKSEATEVFGNVMRVTRMQMGGTQCLAALQTFFGNGTSTQVTISNSAANGSVDLPAIGLRAGSVFVPLLQSNASIQGLRAISIRLKRGSVARGTLPTTEAMHIEVSAVQDFETIQDGVRIAPTVPTLFSGVYLGNATDDAISLEVDQNATGQVTSCRLIGGATSGMSCEDIDSSAKTVNTLPGGHGTHGHKTCQVSALHLNPSGSSTTGSIHWGSLSASPFTVTGNTSDQWLLLQGANKRIFFAASDGASAANIQMNSEYYPTQDFTHSGGSIRLNPSGTGRSNFNGRISYQRSVEYWNDLQIANVFRTPNLIISSGFTGTDATPSVGDGSLYVQGNVTAERLKVFYKTTLDKLLIRNGATLVVGGNLSVNGLVEVAGMLTAKDINPDRNSMITGDITLKPGAMYETNQFKAADLAQPITIHNPLKINFKANTGDSNTLYDCKSMQASSSDTLVCEFASGFTNVVAGGVECNTGQSIRRSKPTGNGDPVTADRRFQGQGWHATCSGGLPKTIYAICCKR